MKASVLNLDGIKVKEIELPDFFSAPIREDIVQKYVEVYKDMQPYAPFYLAGKQASASGKIRHARRKWKTAYGRGISRVPRKIMWRRGTQFYWIGATISGARKGRRSHPPRVERADKRINKNEARIALISSISATANPKSVMKKYISIKEIPKINFPLIAGKDVLKLKTKEFHSLMKKLLNDLFNIAIQHKSIRSGKGKMRNRRYRKNAGMLFVIGDNEKFGMQGIDIVNAKELTPTHLASGGVGRITMYTEEAIKNLGDRIK
ncbi:50S ribosomal protein L4 [Candidatus Pacearchaeota archaeon]|nr:50S ribosomal protein L4 [Candidatus Pacearchaeota archaeon]